MFAAGCLFLGTANLRVVGQMATSKLSQEKCLVLYIQPPLWWACTWNFMYGARRDESRYSRLIEYSAVVLFCFSGFLVLM